MFSAYVKHGLGDDISFKTVAHTHTILIT